MKFSKNLTALATAAALVAGASLAYAQTVPQPTSPNPTGEAANLPLQNNGAAPMNNSGSTMGSTVDSGTTSAQSDIVTPEPRADRN